MDVWGTKLTTVDLQQDRLIENGSSIVVVGVLVANESTSAVSVLFTDIEDTDIFTIVCSGQDSVKLSWPFVIDNGLKITGLVSNGDLVKVTVWHSAGGV